MQRLLIHSLILIFATSGIACACPADVMDADTARHDMHSMHADESAQDCCDDCDGSSALHTESLPVVIVIRFLQDDFEQTPALLTVAIDTAWGVTPTADLQHPVSPLFLPYETPVSRHDRMLD